MNDYSRDDALYRDTMKFFTDHGLAVENVLFDMFQMMSLSAVYDKLLEIEAKLDQGKN